MPQMGVDVPNEVMVALSERCISLLLNHQAAQLVQPGLKTQGPLAWQPTRWRTHRGDKPFTVATRREANEAMRDLCTAPFGHAIHNHP